jgi:hypothetical protein
MGFIWIFNGPKASFPSCVFTARETAEAWIREQGLSGMLTAYPVDCGTYQWAVGMGYFSPQREDQRSAEFIQQFSSASLEHYHYENGNVA